MEFWGVEVSPGKSLTYDPGDDFYLHISQAALGENKTDKGNERVVLKVTVGKTEVVLGTLSQGRCDQISLDVIFDKEFELSHNSRSSSVYFCGYKTHAIQDESFSSDEEVEDVPKAVHTLAAENGKAVLEDRKADQATPIKVPSKAIPWKVEKREARPRDLEVISSMENEEDDDEDEEDDEDDEMDEDISDEDDMETDEEDESDEEEEEDASEEEELESVPKQRPLDSVNPPGPQKKPKLGTPAEAERPGNEAAADYWRSLILASKGQEEKKKAVKSPATPAHAPNQQQSSAQSDKKSGSAKKTPAKENPSTKIQQGRVNLKTGTPASGKKTGEHLCNTCKKNFPSESALTQHNTAKHK